MDSDKAFEVVSAYLVENFEVPREKITPGARLFKDLELDSIDALDMIAQLESEFDMAVVEEEHKKIRTVRDIVDYVVAHI